MSTGVVLAQTNGASAGGLDVFILRRVAAGGRRILSGKSPLVRPFSFEAGCWSTGIAVPFSCNSHDSRICVALNKRRERERETERETERERQRERELSFVFLFSSALHSLFLFLYFLLLFFVSFCPVVLFTFRFLPSFFFFFVCFFIFLSLLQLVLH
jgi:hypothetical protein